MAGNGSRAEGRAAPYAVSLYPVDAAIVAEVQERVALDTFSAAVRFVLRRWADEHGVEVRGRVAPEEAVA